MKRSKFFGLGVAVFALFLGVVQVPQAFAQTYFGTSTERDEWMVEALRKYPHYLIVTDIPGAEYELLQDEMAYALLKQAGTLEDFKYPVIGGTVYQGGADQGVATHLTVFLFEGNQAPTYLYIYFCKDRNTADAVAQNVQSQMAGSSIWGPFTHGSSARNAQDSRKRIIDGLTSYSQYGNTKNPWN